MKFRVITALSFAFFPVFLGSLSAQGFVPGEFFHDDFENGDHRDYDPAFWRYGGWNAIDEVVDGSLVIREIAGGVSMDASSMAPGNATDTAYWTYDDASVTTQVRVLDTGSDETFAGVYGRSRSTAVYFGGIWSDGRLRLGESDALGNITADGIQTGLDPTATDILLRMDFDGDIMSLTAWELGTEMPEPQVTLMDSTLADGTFALLADGTGTVAYRWFEIAPVPEPTGNLLILSAAGMLASLRRRR